MLKAVSAADLHLFRVFLTVTESGGFSAAQIELNVSPSTISTQMANLEARLGLKLCRRGRAGFALTDEGRAVYNSARELLRNCESFVSEVQEIHGDVSGELHLGFADALVSNPDFPIDLIIRNITERMPDVMLVLNEADPLELSRQLLDQRLDAAIHSFPNHAPGLRYVPVFSEVQTLYCSREHTLFSRSDETITVDELEQSDYAGRTYYGGVLKTGNFRPRTVNAKSSSMDGVVACILSGRFLGHLPRQRAQRWVESGRMRAIHPHTQSYAATVECAFLKGTRLARRAKILEDVIISAFPPLSGTD
jgi:DNA-binding transcriptional LysR family regulator